MRRIILNGFLLLLTVIAATAFWQRLAIYDWYRLRGYEPSPRIVEIANQTKMSSYAKRLFYVQHPSLHGKDTFSDYCAQQSERTIILGCYVTNGTSGNIYVFDVTDKRLEGIEEVTSAHEMLHAAYDRLSSSEKERINRLLNTAYELVRDKEFRQIIDNYREDGADVTNELHSMMPTEIRSLPAELEEYYGRYFTDRLTVVKFSEKYRQIFLEQEKKAESLIARIETLEMELLAESQYIEAEQAALSQESQRLDSLRTSNQIEQYNAAVPEYNRRVNNLQSRISAYNQGVAEVQSLITQYNQISQIRRELNQAINSSLKAIDD